MAEINPSLPLFFNMHNTSHSGPLTSFPSAQSCKIFTDHRPDKVVDGRWHTKWCFLKDGMSDTVPKRWTSLGEALRPKFKKTALINAQIATLKRLLVNPYHYKVFCEEGVLIQAGLIRSKEFDPTVTPPVSWGIASYIFICHSFFSFPNLTLNFSHMRECGSTGGLSDFSFYVRKRSTPIETRPKLFSKRQKSIAHKLPRSEILDLTEDPPFSTLPDKEVPTETDNCYPSTSDSLHEEGSDFAPKAKTGYSKKSDAFRTSRPLLLEWIRKDYGSIKDPLEVHGALTRHLIRAINTSYEITHRADLLDDTCEGACEKERALQLWVKELKEANERLKQSEEFHLEAGKEAAYCLCRFTKIYRDVNSSIVANYQDFIQEYPEE
ncbi:hypothetical protein LIER_20172 [Lithospermum erythrorhizon]|uniref:Uncharacterized protein n=1 Tax=Lithospermum erythrorhizon TaxID=34254 RepID=A0AAV3QLM0_LITER